MDKTEESDEWVTVHDVIYMFFFNGIKIGTSLVNGNMEMHSAYNLGYIHIYIYIAIVARIYLIWHI